MSSTFASRRGPEEEINPFQINSDDDDDQQRQRPSRSTSHTNAQGAGESSSSPWCTTDHDGPTGTAEAPPPPYRGDKRGKSQDRQGASTASSAQGQQQQQRRPQPIPAPEMDMNDLSIIDAQKTTDHVGASSFIVYVIRCDNVEAKRRYSEFEALRSALVQLHPTLIIPPIPSKHTLSDYAVKQSKAKEDATIIARRKRMLQSFLRRCADHPDLKQSEVFRKFLDGRWSWHEISTTPPISSLPKSNLKAPAANPADLNASPAYASLPLPSSAGNQLRNPSQRFLDSEAFTTRFANHMSGSVEKANRRVARRWGDSAGDFAELGAVLNGFALSESGQMATAMERLGQASDSTFISVGGLLQDWEQSVTEPLHEYVQFASVLQKLLKWRHLKHLQFELAQDALEAKRLKLEELERVEAEAKRLERALETGGRSLTGGGGSGSGGGAWDSTGSGRVKSSIYGGAVDPQDDEGFAGSSSAVGNSGAPGGARDNLGRGADGDARSQYSQSGSGSGEGTGSSGRSSANSRGHHSSGSSSGGGGGGGGGIFSALSHTFSSVLDVDPESTRRREISRLKEEIASLDEALQLTSQDLSYATNKIQADLDRFQRMKIRDFRSILLRCATMHRDFCRVNQRNWEEAKVEIEKVENKKAGAGAGSGGGSGSGGGGEWPSYVMPEGSLGRKESAERDD